MPTRRLPVIQEPQGEDAEAAARPAWQWVLIGSGLLVTFWTPGVALVLAVAGKVGGASGAPGPGLAAALVAGTLALSALAAGYLLGRFGRRTQRRHALMAGVLAAVEIWLLALLGRAFSSAWLGASALLSLSVLSAAFCGLGAWISRRGAPG